MRPRATIGIPTVSRHAYLVEAVESALGQTCRDVEVLVSDDGTTAEIPAWCRERAAADPRLRYHRNPAQLGLAGNWNALVERASGEFIVLLGDDDRLHPRFVEKLLAAAAPGTAVVFCNHRVIDAEGRLPEGGTEEATRRFHRDRLPAGRLEAPSKSAWQLAICPSAVLTRTSEARRLGFRPDLNSPDVEFFIRLAGEGARFDFVPKALSDYRVHANSATGSGLWNEKLAMALIGLPASPDAEPFKTELLARLLVNGVSRCLDRGDVVSARRLLGSGYYPGSRLRLSQAVQRFCAWLPAPAGSGLYRAIRRCKNWLTT